MSISNIIWTGQTKAELFSLAKALLGSIFVQKNARKPRLEERGRGGQLIIFANLQSHCLKPVFLYITKTCLYNLDPLKRHFYIVKLEFTGVYIIFAQNIDCAYSLEPPQQGGSNEYAQSMF